MWMNLDSPMSTLKVQSGFEYPTVVTPTQRTRPHLRPLVKAAASAPAVQGGLRGAARCKPC